MLSPRFTAREIDGHKFDRGMILVEFDALREPEATQFPQIGAWVKQRIPMVEAPTPSMHWRGAIWPDLYIANQLDAVPEGWCAEPLFKDDDAPAMDKRTLPDHFTLELISRIMHGSQFHDAFIEPMCRKIAGRSSSEIAAKYHRALWLPLYWPETLRARKSIRTPFWYPAAGYIGIFAETLGVAPLPPADPAWDRHTLHIAYALAKPASAFSVLNVVEHKAIYRITDMDACARISAPLHRYTIESCAPIEAADLSAFMLEPAILGREQVRFVIPTIKNLALGWTPAPHMNAQLWAHINGA